MRLSEVVVRLKILKSSGSAFDLGRNFDLFFERINRARNDHRREKTRVGVT